MNKAVTLLQIILFFLLISCEDVIKVDTDTAPPRLAVEAAINWQKGTDGNIQTIKLTTTTGYFENTIPVVSGAIVTVTNTIDNQVFNFIENPGTGVYICSDFIPKLNTPYTLTIISKGETYSATEKMYKVASITKLSQNNNGGITGTDIEIKTYYNDPIDETNYYLFRYEYDKKADLYTDEDTFYNGNEFFSISQNDSLKVGEKIGITHLGISKSYYNYMTIITNQASQGGGSPFQSPPSTVRGNIVNKTNSNNYPLGYFSVSEIDYKEYTIQ